MKNTEDALEPRDECCIDQCCIDQCRVSTCIEVICAKNANGRQSII